MCELRLLREQVTKDEIQAKLQEFEEKFDVSKECSTAELRRAAKTSCALDKLVKTHQLGSLAYYYEGMPGNEYENIVTSVILDYRGYDTLGEITVLFTAILGALTILRGKSKKGE